MIDKILLPRTIVKHPYFHEDITNESAAIKLLKRSKKQSFLFFFNRKTQEFTLFYQIFINQLSYHKLRFEYNLYYKTIMCSDIRLGESYTLQGVIKNLKKHYDEVIKKKFIPYPLYNSVARLQLSNPLLKESGLPLVNPDIMLLIINQLDMLSINSLMRTCKGYSVTLYNFLPNLINYSNDLKEKAIELRVEQIKFIHHIIVNKIKPRHREEEPNNQYIKYNDFIISDVEWYNHGTSTISCKINNSYYVNQFIYVSKDLRFKYDKDNHKKILDSVYGELENACRYGEIVTLQ